MGGIRDLSREELSELLTISRSAGQGE
jgi:hypothetical protein